MSASGHDWRVYYGDGSTYAGDVAQAPARDVQVIAQSHPEYGWLALSGSDYYVWRGGRWFGVDRFGLYDYLIEPGWRKVLFGRTLTSDEFDAVWQRMMADPDGPEKIAPDKRGRRP